MGSDILSGDIGDEFLISVRLNIEDQTTLSLLDSVSQALCAEKHPEFQRHVEPRKMVCWVGIGPGKVVNAKSALFDNLKNLLDSNLAPVLDLKRAARAKATVDDSEVDRFE